MKLFVAIATLALCLFALVEGRCTDSKECGPSECCMVSRMMNSLPTCIPMQAVGVACSPYVRAVNTTLKYPDDSVVELTNVYLNMCTCEAGLSCDKRTGTCQHA